jgi:hypothetical protein
MEVLVPPPLGRLTQVPLRDVWESEAAGFTPWLAQTENLALLSEALSLSLEFEAQEQDVGPFRADILCKDTANDHWVLIENQLERTDHTHLGQLLTYAAGLQAVTIVWIAERFTEEHRAALDWLNDITDDRFNFFGIQIELWKIGASPVAPKFAIISKPNEWTKAVQQSAQAVTATPTKQLQLAFWTGFREYMQDEGSVVKCQKPLPQHWTNHAIGRSGFHLTSIFSSWDSAGDKGGGEIRAELVIDHDQAKRFFPLLARDQSAIEAELGFTLVWHNPPDAKIAKAYIRKAVDMEDRDSWPDYFIWLRQHLEKMYKVFGPRVRALALQPVAGEPELAAATQAFESEERAS